MSEDKQRFLSRWSRRKLDAAKEALQPKPVPPPVAVARTEATPELPSIETLRGLASEYKDFLRPGVDEKLRQAALKKLFRDPHFNVMDGLDVYIDDYSKPDPIPDAMLRTLAHARGLLFEEQKEEKAEPKQGADPPAATALPEAPMPSAPEPMTPAEKKDKV
ncbi:MAG TPA: DUF3306 domain-containing protein [Burkholderiales bacterium]|nr:DUF3306 domain-containing protein [Burkholderiales bacterium]